MAYTRLKPKFPQCRSTRSTTWATITPYHNSPH